MLRTPHVIAVLAAFALLTSTSATAVAGPPGHAKHGAKKKSKHYYDGAGRRGNAPWITGKRRHGTRRGGGLPPWAPAHGYRRKYVTYHTHDRRVVSIPESDLVLRSADSIAQCNRDVIGAVFGGATGAAVGSRIGKGSGNTAATIAGAILGAMIGGNIGRAMDQVDQNCVGQALERAETGQPVVWRNPDNCGDYQVTPTETYQSAGGDYCREYTTTVVIGGQSERAHGKACRQSDGSWRREG